jgi:hypothetical protein
MGTSALAPFQTGVSQAWETKEHSPIIQFWTDDGQVYGFEYNHLRYTHHNRDTGLLLIYWAPGYIAMRGEKIESFIEQFSEHGIRSIKSFGHDIQSVLFFDEEEEKERMAARNAIQKLEL